MANTTETKLPLTENDRSYLKKRTDFINQKNEEILKINTELRVSLLHERSDQGDNRKLLMEIPFEAVTFHDLDDKKGYEKGTFVNFDILGIHTIQILYVEGKTGGGFCAFSGLRLNFVWNQLQRSKSTKSGIAAPYYGSFNDATLCFAEVFCFQTEEQYIAFKKIYTDIKNLAESLGTSL